MPLILSKPLLSNNTVTLVWSAFLGVVSAGILLQSFCLGHKC